MALQVRRVAALHGGVPQVGLVRSHALVGEQRGGVELLVVGIPQAQRLHNLVVLVVGIAQCAAVLGLEETVGDALHADVVAGVLESGDAVAQFSPRRTTQIVLIDAGGHANPRLGRAVEHRAPDALHVVGAHDLPVVRAGGHPLHQVDFRQVLAVGKRLVADEEVRACVGRVGSRIAVLEIDALQSAQTLESTVDDAAQVGMALEVAHQVVDEIHLAVLGYAVGVCLGHGDVVLLGVHIPALAVGIPPVVLGRVDAGVEETRVVVARQVRVLHALVRVGDVVTPCVRGRYRQPQRQHQ